MEETLPIHEGEVTPPVRDLSPQEWSSDADDDDERPETD